MNFGASIILHKGDFNKFSSTISTKKPSIICLNQYFTQQFHNKIRESSNDEDVFGDKTKIILIENFVSNPKVFDLLDEVCGCEILEISGEAETCGVSNIRSKNNKYDFKKIFSSFKLSDALKTDGEVFYAEKRVEN